MCVCVCVCVSLSEHGKQIESAQRKLTEHNALLSMERIDIDALKKQAMDTERDVERNTAQLRSLQVGTGLVRATRTYHRERFVLRYGVMAVSRPRHLKCGV